MTELVLYSKISALPLDLQKEAIDFVDFLLSKQKAHKSNQKKQRVFGYAKGSITIKPDFDEPLEEFRAYM